MIRDEEPRRTRHARKGDNVTIRLRGDVSRSPSRSVRVGSSIAVPAITGTIAQVTSQLAVRRASAADADLVTEIITLSFARDPLWAHAMARPGGGTAHHGEFWRLS